MPNEETKSTENYSQLIYEAAVKNDKAAIQRIVDTSGVDFLELIPRLAEGYAFGNHLEELNTLVSDDKNKSIKNNLLFHALKGHAAAGHDAEVENYLDKYLSFYPLWLSRFADEENIPLVLKILNKDDVWSTKIQSFEFILRKLLNGKEKSVLQLMEVFDPELRNRPHNKTIMLNIVFNDYLKNNKIKELENFTLNDAQFANERLAKLCRFLSYHEITQFNPSTKLRNALIAKAKELYILAKTQNDSENTENYFKLLSFLSKEPAYTLPGFTTPPKHYVVTKESKDLFERARDLQGFAIVAWKTGEESIAIGLVPAFNKDDNLIRSDKDGNPIPYVASEEAKLGQNTGVIHEKAVAYFKETKQIPPDLEKKYMFGAGIFKGSHALQFRNKSANLNRESVVYNRKLLLANYFSDYPNYPIPTPDNLLYQYYISRELPRAISSRMHEALSEQLVPDFKLEAWQIEFKPGLGIKTEEQWENNTNLHSLNTSLMHNISIAIRTLPDPTLVKEMFSCIHSNLEILEEDTPEKMQALLANLPEIPLLVAAENNLSSHIVDILLDEGAPIDQCDSEGNTALLLAAKKGKTDMVKKLWDKGANIHVENKANETPFKWAITYGDADLVKRILNNAKPEEKMRTENHGLFSSSTSSSRIDINATDKYGNTPLSLAVAKGHLPVVKVLIESKANPNVEGMDPGRTNPLWQAVKLGHVEIVAYLLANNADPARYSNAAGESFITTTAKALAEKTEGGSMHDKFKQIVSLLEQHELKLKAKRTP